MSVAHYCEEKDVDSSPILIAVVSSLPSLSLSSSLSACSLSFSFSHSLSLFLHQPALVEACPEEFIALAPGNIENRQTNDCIIYYTVCIYILHVPTPIISVYYIYIIIVTIIIIIILLQYTVFIRLVVNHTRRRFFLSFDLHIIIILSSRINIYTF